ncbi:eIF-2-alpha kinase GCN2 [Dendroctonus ponderosae]|uniref:eIF-2-alpha kinase GCN2 n=1 Tax=Dendroctonus ponderosae TaxID=77166 RepID=UPI002035D2A4|nr:eIF-2-alpha kinase GCN2 [Dendroctonus ponderosae]
MSGEDTVNVRQAREFEALQGIYMNQLKDLRQKPAWKTTFCPLNLSISLTPQLGASDNGEVHVQVDLHVICSSSYPRNEPIIRLENSKGIAHTLLKELQKDLEETATLNKGEEVIYKLCEQVREFLRIHNNPGMISFYHEMEQTQRQKVQEIELQKQLEANRQKEIYLKQVQERRKMIEAEARDWRRSRENSENAPDVARRLTGGSKPSDELPCNHKAMVSLDFNGRQVHRGRCIKHIDTSSVIYSALDAKTGEMLEVAEWTLKPKKQEVSQLMKNIASIEQELNYYMAKLRHPNLVNYLGMKHDSVGDQVVVYVLKEFVLGSDCSLLFLGQNRKIDWDLLRHLAQDVLSALDYLHRINVPHKGLKYTCVTISERGEVKLSNYGIHKRLSDLVTATQKNYSKKRDIYDFGRMILSLLGQKDVPEANVEIPTSLPSDLFEFLYNCLNKDDKERFTAKQLLDHSFLHTPNIFDEYLDLPDTPPPEISDQPVPVSSNNSLPWIQREFLILNTIGSGAFGKVLKAWNKLDRRFYAIKKIKLDRSSKALNKKKILREVTLLSKLNHENIVRYFYSWTDTTTIKDDATGDSGSSGLTTATHASDPKQSLKVGRNNEFTSNGCVEELAPPAAISVITFNSKSQPTYGESSEDESSEEEDDDDDDDDETSDKRFIADSGSDSIIFEAGSAGKSLSSKQPESVDSKPLDKSRESEAPKEHLRQMEYLYIQMEFCERSTLRTAIDADIYKNPDRVWRFFREIVEGLAYIHMQNIIHRDLKPDNVFLDSFDRVKIGDFGLATSIGIKSKPEVTPEIAENLAESLKEDLTEEGKTGNVGTAMYAAPEINSTLKTLYNEKVDIYSLGIILFEMCHKPFETRMERIVVLNALRTKDIVFPDGFPESNERAHTLVRLLLNHDIAQRPSSQELLQSKHMPPPVLVEQRMQQVVRYTLSNPQTKGYRYLISACFKQSLSPAQDITYDRGPSIPIAVRLAHLYDHVRATCVKVFKQHGGQELSTPLLMPKCKYNESVDSCVNLMAHFGNIVSLPYDLRVSFARYVALNHINCLRRYSVEKVFKEKKMFGFLPREFYEGAFDIVTASPGSHIADAEILYIAYQIISELPGERTQPFLIQLNHTLLFEALLLHFDLKDREQEVLDQMRKLKKSRDFNLLLSNFLTQAGLSEPMVNSLSYLLCAEFEPSKAASCLQMVTKNRSNRKAADLAKTALHELKIIVEYAECFGVKFEFQIVPGLIYNIHQHSGMIFQCVYEIQKKRNQKGKEILAAGGRYDAMIQYYRNLMEQINMAGKDVQQSAVGISISLDILVHAILKQDVEEVPIRSDSLNIAVCSVGQKPNSNFKEKIKVVRNLQEAGCSFSLIEAPNENALEYQLFELNFARAIIFRDDNQSIVKVRYWDKSSKGQTRFNDKEVPISSIVESMQRILRIRVENIGENGQPSATLIRSESKSSYSEKNDLDAEIVWITSDKFTSNSRKRYENQVRTQLDRVFRKLSGVPTVIVVNLDSKFVSELSSSVDFDSEDQFNRSVQDLTSKSQKHKQCVKDICDEIRKIRLKNDSPTIILYGLADKCYKVIM